jgi:carboxyl-terminal processing protease
MSRFFKLSILAVSAGLIVFIFAGSFGPTRLRAQSGNDGAYRQMEVYSEVLKRIQNDYVEDPNISLVTTGALHGLLESLDADSSYLSPSEYIAYKQLQKEGHAQIGLIVSKRFGYATVITVLKGSPAEKANIEDGDIIEAIGDKTTREMSVATIRGLLSGAPGTNVTLSVIRPRKLDPDKLIISRTVVGVPAFAEQQYDSNTILYLKPGSITPDRVKEIEAKLRAMPSTGGHKVLLDLRDTADGDYAAADKLANLFIKQGVLASLQGQKYPKQTFNADASKAITSAPLAVLVNHGTAGPAELVAAAVLDSKRGDVIGDRTFGEGSVQKLFELPDGAALILSIAKYYGPDGKAIEDDAVTPNVQVASSDDSAIPDDESVDTSNAAPAKPVVKPDDQLNKALDLLKQKQA